MNNTYNTGTQNYLKKTRNKHVYNAEVIYAPQSCHLSYKALRGYLIRKYRIKNLRIIMYNIKLICFIDTAL